MSPRVPKQQVEETRQSLLAEGVAQFVARGYHGTGIKQILDAVGVPKGSFYNYFASKEAFGAATIEFYADSMAAALARCLEQSPSAYEGLRAFFQEDLERLRDQEYLGGCLVANLGAELDGAEACRDALEKALGRYIDGITAALAQAQAEGDVRDDLPAVELARLLVDAWEGAVIRLKIQRSTAPLEQCLERLLEGFFRP